MAETTELFVKQGSPMTVLEKSPSWRDAHTSIDIISQNMKAMVKKIQDLRHLGIEDKGLPLPKICVVGDQSAGKSSLIEGMSEIKVPRSSGCCTRCPLEINLSESDQPWACKVLLMKKYLYDNSARAKRATHMKPLGPWIEQDPEEIHFANVTDIDVLQQTLKNAQLATLNPGRAPEEFMDGEESDTQVKFSPNVIRLDISAPRFPDLSFYDLPGVINVAEVDEERYLVALVRNLVKDYIKAENSIVLLTMPMTDDATNSSTAGIIRDVPGAIDRTLGVLTKPDRIQFEEGYAQWEEILRGDKFSIGHGYYVVKNNPDPTVDHAQAREEELYYFTRGAWTEELGEYSDRFGMRALQAALSQLLLQQIQNSLPDIVHQITSRAAKIDAELVTLPDPPTENIPFIICDKLHTYGTNIRCHIDGGLREYPFLKHWSQIAADFQKYLVDSRPTLKLREKEPVWKVSTSGAGAGDDFDCEISHCQPSPKRKGAVNGTQNGTLGEHEAKRVKVMSSPAPSMPPPSASGGTSRFATEHFTHFDLPAKVFELEEIRSIHEDTYQSGVPGLGNPQAVETMNRMSVRHWKDPMEKFLSVTYAEIHKILLEELDKVFAEYSQTNLYRELRLIIFEFIDSTRDEHLRDAIEKYNIECLKPFTMATAAFQKAQKEAFEFLKSRRQRGRAMQYSDEVEKAQSGKKLDPSKVTEAEMGPDMFEKEVEIMAAVRAYYDIASWRFVDTMCQSIHTKLFFKCRNSLKEVVQNELGIVSANASERCQQLMIEDNERDARRRYLKKEKEKLAKAQASLRDATGF